MDYFSLFGLPIYYHLDQKELESRFQNLQLQYHPDKFINGTELDKLSAISRSAIINQAWKTLRNPITRAEYLLSLKGVDVINELNTVCDSSFLTEQLDLNEELHQIEQAKDTILLEKFINRLQEILNTCQQKMAKELNNKTWDLAAETVQKLRFLNKLRSSAEKLEEKLLNC